MTEVRTADSDQPYLGWTCNSGTHCPGELTSGEKVPFTRDQLPDPDVQRAAGIPVELWGRFLAVAE